MNSFKLKTWAPIIALGLSAGTVLTAHENSPDTEQNWKQFGDDFTLTETVKAEEFLEHPATYLNKAVRVEGIVADVCQMKGCWLILAEGERSIRVTMKDYGFFVDRDSTGDRVHLEGTVVEKEVDPEHAAHMISESQRPDLAPEGKAQTKVYEFVATAIRIWH